MFSIKNFFIDKELIKWLKKVKNKKQYNFPVALIINLTEITVSTARGVLHEKTVGNQYQKFVLPIIDIQNTIKEDLIIEY